MQRPAQVYKAGADAMTFDEYIKRFGKVTDELKSHYYGQIMASVGMEARKMIFERVTKKGEDAQGQKYRPYSTKAMLVGCKGMNTDVCNKVFGSKEKRRNLEWRTVKGNRLAILPGGYKQFRELHGRQTQHVDFTFSGKMWGAVNLISNQGHHQNGIALIGARDELSKKKLAGNTERRTDILDLSKSEQDELKKKYGIEALSVFKNNGL